MADFESEKKLIRNTWPFPLHLPPDSTINEKSPLTAEDLQSMRASDSSTVTTNAESDDEDSVTIPNNKKRNYGVAEVSKNAEKSRSFGQKSKIRLLLILTAFFGSLSVVLLITTVIFALRSRSQTEITVPSTVPMTTTAIGSTAQIISTTLAPSTSDLTPRSHTEITVTSTLATTTTTVGSTVQIVSTTLAPNTSDQCYAVRRTPGWLRASQNILNSIDFAADPCHDFYQYACGVWPLKNPLPKDRSKYTIYTAVRERVSNDTRNALGRLNLREAPEAVKKLKTVYDLCRNEVLAENLKGTPLIKLFEDENNGIGAWPAILQNWQPVNYSPETVIGQIKRLYGIDTVLFTYVYAYDLNSTESILQFSGAMLPLGLGIFSARYYLNDTLYGYIMQGYLDLMAKSAKLLVRDAGNSKYAVKPEDFKEILNFETKLAAAVSKAEWNIDKWNISDLQSTIPNFDWNGFFDGLLPEKARQLSKLPNFRVEMMSPRFLKTVTTLIKNTPARTVQNYLIWRLVKYSLPFLSVEYRDALQNFTSLLTGNNQALPRWQTCVGYIKGRFDLPSLGYATGRVFVDEYFTNGEKYDVEGMVGTIIETFEKMITNLTWMDNWTKKSAIAKARSMRPNVAYPDWIRNDTFLDEYYSSLNAAVASNGNMMQTNLILRGWAAQKNFLSLLGPFDRRKFGGPPSATDAWYSAPGNSLSIPSGELQMPFYALGFPRAVNFGAVGAVIGHEMTHGFDSSGSQYDSQGNLRDWWSPASRQAFRNRTQCLVKQYDKFCYKDLGLCVNGANTVTENTADLGGLKSAYLAYKQNTFQFGSEPRLPGLESFSPDQIFFLSFASFWCGSATSQALRNSLLTDNHSPDRLRVVGTLQNLPEFAQAFQCAKGSVMNPVEKCSVW